MRRILILFAIVSSFLISCVNTQEKIIELDAKSPENKMFKITNNGDLSAEFSMFINDLDFSSNYKIIQYINEMPEVYPEEPLEMKAYRFIFNYTFKEEQLTNSTCFNEPSLVLNSLGGGLCGLRSTVLTNLLKGMGFKAKSICLEGHVVTEVFSGNKWKILDVDYGVCFLNNDTQIASYLELVENPMWFDEIDRYISIDSSESIKLNAFMMNNAYLYSSKEDNHLFKTGYDVNQNTILNTIVLPPKSNFIFPYENCKAESIYTCAKLEVPAGWCGEIWMPFVLCKIEGNATVKIDGNKLVCSEKQTGFVKLGSSDNKCVIISNQKGVNFYYYINPLVYKVDTTNHLRFKGKNIDDLTVELSQREDSVVFFKPKFSLLLLDFIFNEIDSSFKAMSKEVFESNDSIISYLCKITDGILLNDENTSLRPLRVDMSEQEQRDFIIFLEQQIKIFKSTNCNP